MHSSSADTSYTFGDNTVAVADGGNQSSPGTEGSGTAMEWNNISSRGRSSASNRSSRATSKRDQQHRGHRTPRTAGPLIQILKPEAICNNPPVAMVTTVTVSTPESDGKVLIPGPQACRTTVLILEAIAVGGFGNQIPARFTTWRQEDVPCTDKAVARWIENVQIPIIFIVSLAFGISRRDKQDKVIHALTC